MEKRGNTGDIATVVRVRGDPRFNFKWGLAAILDALAVSSRALNHKSNISFRGGVPFLLLIRILLSLFLGMVSFPYGVRIFPPYSFCR